MSNRYCCFCRVKCVANCICQAKLGVSLTALLYTIFYADTELLNNNNNRTGILLGYVEYRYTHTFKATLNGFNTDNVFLGFHCHGANLSQAMIVEETLRGFILEWENA